MKRSPSKRRALCGWMGAAAWIVGGVLALQTPAAQAQAGPRGTVGFAELTPETEAAIDRALAYLSGRQGQDGSWSNRYPVATTAMTLMAFMLQGHFPEEGRYGAALDRGVLFLVERSERDGGFLGDRMYGHGFATLALSEVWGMSRREEVRDALKRAVDVLLRSQNRTGGWRYTPEATDADVSVVATQLVALASAREAGIMVPASAMADAIAYMASCQHPSGGFGYQRNRMDPAFPRSAAALMSIMIAGQRTGPRIERGLHYLNSLSNEDISEGRQFWYAHYYAIQAMYQAGEAPYQRWKTRVEPILLARQREDGSFTGDYHAELNTAMAVLVLGVPYRFLPIYQR